LCRGFEQITRTTPFRLTILQFSQMRFTELLTFIFNPMLSQHCALHQRRIRNWSLNGAARFGLG
jgi:hypothetical protein